MKQIFALLTFLPVLAFAFKSSTSSTSSKSTTSSDDVSTGPFILICHFDAGAGDAPATMCVDIADVPSHLAHGDHLGGCNASSKQGKVRQEEQPPVMETDEMLVAFPNPFNDQVSLQFSVPRSTRGDLSVFNLMGEKLEELYRGAIAEDQIYTLEFKATKLPAGIYIARLRTVDGKITHVKIYLAR